MIQRFLTILILNFSALSIGGIFTNKGVISDWYENLNKAPWTPPGWMFGVAWTTIMICFAFYMTLLISKNSFEKKRIFILFGIQWILNTAWNPTFFYFHQPLLGLVLILSLTFLIGWFLFKNYTQLKSKSLWIAPYFIWLLIAVSLNGYVVIMN